MDRYSSVLAFVRRTPWAILPEKLAEIRVMLADRAAGLELDEDELEARFGAARFGGGGRPSEKPYGLAGDVAIIPVAGSIVPRADLLSRMSGATSAETLSATFSAALADGDVSSILLDVDSPGGAVELVPELAATIRAARGSKPIVAVANTRAASAAYWIASQADEVVVTPSGDVGSIGVLAAHQDVSAALEKSGVRTTLITATRSPYKGEANPFEPLTEEAAAHLQELVDEFHATFEADVAKGRRVSVNTVREDFGQGRMLTAKAAVRAGMADRVDTFDATLKRMARGNVKPAPPAPDDVEQELADLADAGDAEASADVAFTVQAGALRESAERLVVRLASLAEARRGELTVAKREHASACSDALRAAASSIDDVLKANEPSPPPGTNVIGAGLDAELALFTLKERTRSHA